MGQYWKAVNLDKHEYIRPHMLDAGAKLGEQLGTHMGSALIILCAAMREVRGGGDLELSDDTAKRTIGRWAGDRVALVGDYAEDSDLPAEFEASKIYGKCSDGGDWTDVTDDVCRVIEHECGGVFQGEGWRRFTVSA